MRTETRSGFSTVLWLALYVGLLPLIVVGGAMFLADLAGATDEGWGVVFAVGYLVALLIGGNLFAAQLERSR